VPFWPRVILGPGGPVVLTSAASYLGLKDRQLLQLLSSGKSLAQIAKARGKAESGLEQAITAAVASQLHKAVITGRIPRALEHRLLDALARHVQDIVSLHGPPGALLPPAVIQFSMRRVGPPP